MAVISATATQAGFEVEVGVADALKVAVGVGVADAFKVAVGVRVEVEVVEVMVGVEVFAGNVPVGVIVGDIVMVGERVWVKVTVL